MSEVQRAIGLVGPLENKGVIIKGANVVEKAKSLLKRGDYNQLSFLANNTPATYGGLGEVSDEPSSKSLDALDRAILSN